MRERGREEGGWKESDSTKQRVGVNGGHRVMRGLNATNAMSQGLIKTSSALLPRSGHAHMHLCNGSGGFVGGWQGEHVRVLRCKLHTI